MLSKTIKFEFEGDKYEVPATVEEFFYIQLPDGRTLQVNSWMETFPPSPTGFKVVETDSVSEARVATLIS